MKHLFRTLTVLVALFAAGTTQATTLDVLLNGGTITAGDKLFDNWRLLFYGSGDGRNFNAANIDVQPLNDGGLDPGPGLSFGVSNNELSVTGDGIYNYVDLKFGFRASVLDPLLLIKDNSLNLTGGVVTNSGDNGMYIHEDIGTALGGNDLGTKQVEFSWLDGTGLIQNLTDSASFVPHSEIWVTKNILVWSVDDTDTASLNGFGQRFSQTSEVIPEPATLALTALGLVGLAAMRRRKS